MQLSSFAIKVLKNFSLINEGIIVQKGTVQKTVANNEEIYAKATLPDDFPQEFAIANINKFIANVEAFSDAPELDFQSAYVKLKSKAGAVTYGYAGKNVVRAVEVDIEDPDYTVTFNLSKDVLARIIKFANINGSPSIAFECENGELFLKAFDRKESTATVTRLSAGTYDGKKKPEDFSIIVQSENFLKVIDGNYVVDLFEDKLARMTYTDENGSTVVYHLAPDITKED